MYIFELLSNNNDYLLDGNLSLSAKALLTLALVYNNIDDDTIDRTNTDSRDDINKALEELIKFNYVKHNNNDLSFYASAIPYDELGK